MQHQSGERPGRDCATISTPGAYFGCKAMSAPDTWGGRPRTAVDRPSSPRVAPRLSSRSRLNRNGAPGRLRFLDRDRDGEHPPVVLGLDVALVGSGRQADGTVQHPVAKLRVVLGVLLLTTLGPDFEHAVGDRHLDVLLR